MSIKASGRSALIIAAGIWVCFSGPSQAAGSADRDASAVSNQGSKAIGAPIVLKKYTKSRHLKKYAQRKSDKVALKSATDKKAAEAEAADNNGDDSTAIPPSVANANAQLASADTPTGAAAKAMTARASNILQNPPDNPADTPPAAESQVVAADQLNELDRALQETKPRARPMTLASAEASAPAAAPVVASSSNESSTWDQTSLIGKIFIAFGGLLTLASAARMFMA
jgi:hypothetical protein